MNEIRVLMCDEVAAEVRFTPKAVRQLIAEGKFPPPIDPTMTPRRQRWSSLTIDAWKEGRWTPSRNGSAA